MIRMDLNPFARFKTQEQKMNIKRTWFFVRHNLGHNFLNKMMKERLSS